MDPATSGMVLVVANKLLGKTADAIAIDIAKIYSSGKEKLLSVFARKIKDMDDWKQANLRVARDVLLNGAFTDESICAEYFWGILASSRSDDGKDDSGVYYVDIIKSLSSAQLHLHYVIYRSLNNLFISDITKVNLNVWQSTELYSIKIYFSAIELGKIGLKIDTDLEALYRKWLIHEYKTDNHKISDKDSILPYVSVVPTTLGIQLLCIANNMFSDWRSFTTKNIGDFKDIQIPQYSDFSLEGIIEKI